MDTPKPSKKVKYQIWLPNQNIEISRQVVFKYETDLIVKFKEDKYQSNELNEDCIVSTLSSIV